MRTYRRKTNTKWLSDYELFHIMEEAEDTPIFAAILILLYTGIKTSELIALKTGDIEPIRFKEGGAEYALLRIERYAQFRKGGVLYTPHYFNYSARRRQYVLPPFVLDAILEKINKSVISICAPDYNDEYREFIFVNEKGDLYQPSYLNKMFKKYIYPNRKGLTLSIIRQTFINRVLPEYVVSPYLKQLYSGQVLVEPPSCKDWESIKWSYKRFTDTLSHKIYSGKYF